MSDLNDIKVSSADTKKDVLKEDPQDSDESDNESDYDGYIYEPYNFL